MRNWAIHGAEGYNAWNPSNASYVDIRYNIPPFWPIRLIERRDKSIDHVNIHFSAFASQSRQSVSLIEHSLLKALAILALPRSLRILASEWNLRGPCLCFHYFRWSCTRRPYVRLPFRKTIIIATARWSCTRRPHVRLPFWKTIIIATAPGR